MKRPLTNQQQAVYNLIRDRIIHRGYGPTVREIGEHMGIKSPNGVMSHLRALERKGMILRASNKSRAIELTESISSLVGATLKVQGNIAKGICTLVSEDCQQIDVAQLTGQGNGFLRVCDDSLTELQILPGDLLILRKQPEATAGQLALVRTVDQGICLRIWLPNRDVDPVQPMGQPLPLHKAMQPEVMGVIIGVIRMFQAGAGFVGLDDRCDGQA